jgi:small subunit ribosomal protein S4
MSRYTGPRLKRMRALGTELPGLSPKKIEKRPYPPGQHGQSVST